MAIRRSRGSDPFQSAQNAVVRDAVLSRLTPLPVVTRAMFGAVGLYLDGRFFGVVSSRRLYFRTDDHTRSAYIERGSRPLEPMFRPRGPRTVDRNFEVAAEIFDDADLFRAWAVRAAEGVPKRRSRPRNA
jgi:DNA transformation protein